MREIYKCESSLSCHPPLSSYVRRRDEKESRFQFDENLSFMNLITPSKDKLEDMDVSLTFCNCPKWALIFKTTVTQQVGQIQILGCHMKTVAIHSPLEKI